MIKRPFAVFYSPDDEGAGGGGASPAGDGGAPAGIPEGIPAQFVDPKAGGVMLPELAKSYAELSTFKTDYDTRIAALPKTAEDYQLELKLPADVKVPEGLELKIDAKDPRAAPIKAFAHKHKLAPDVLNELVALDAKMQVDAYNAEASRIQAEQAKLGSNGPARVTAVESFLKANMSKDEYEALRPVIGDAVAFAAVEKLVAKATTQRIPGQQPGANIDPAPPKPRTADVFYGNGKAN